MAKPKDMTPQGKALREAGKKWLARIEAAGKAEKVWMDDADVAVKAYTGEGNKVDTSTAGSGVAYDFNIQFANVETIVPAVINSAPAPDIRRRFGSDDPVAKDLAEILERAIRVQVDDSKLQTEMEAMAQDGFLAGRGVIRMRFMSDIVGGETTDEELGQRLDDEQPGAVASEVDEGESKQAAAGTETVTNERIAFEAVSWRDYRHGPAKRWDDRPWDAFRHSIPNEEIDEFADAGLLASQADPEDDETASDADRTVWEVWDKKSRTVIFVSAGDGKVLKKVPDPLGLSKFFPIPTPIQAIELTGRLMPVNPFSIYRKLAEELDTTTKRIRIITKQLKVKGWYGASPTDIQAILEADDNEFAPISDPEIWATNGGIQGAVAFWPVEKLIVVLTQLYQNREQTKQAIYEITGISDIVRGASKASETLGAQQLKSQWGSLRIQKMQRMMERAARDMFVMMAEVIPSKFSPETLQLITDVQIVPSEQDLTPAAAPQVPPGAPPEAQQQAAQQAQQAEQARQQKLQHLTKLRALMAERLVSYYRIDVESDSTIRADLTRQKQEATEFMQAASGYFGAVAPLVQQGALPMEVAVEIFSSFSRMFNLGKTVEDALDELVKMAKEKASQPPPEDPAKAQAAADAEAKKQELQLRQQGAATKAKLDELELQIKQTDGQAKAALEAEKLALEKQKVAVEGQRLALETHRYNTELARTERDAQWRQSNIEADRQAHTDAAFVAAGVPPGYSFDEDRQQMKILLEKLSDNSALAQAIETLAAAATAPKRVVRGPDGVAVGVETIGS